MFATPAIESAAAHRQTRLALTIIAFGLATTFVGGWLSEGMHHFDDLAHFLMAKWAWQDPRYLVYDWARPGFTILYILPAQFGWHAARAMSALLSAITAWIAFRLAERCSIRNAFLVPLFLYTQPLFFELSMTTLTETALAFVLVAALDLASKGHWTASSAILSVAFVTRHEAVTLLPVWIVFALLRGVPIWRLWPLPWAVLVVNIAARLTNLPLAAARWIDPSPHSWYGAGGWLTMTARSIQAWGPAIAALAIAGLPSLWRDKWGRMVATSMLVLFALLTAIRALGLFEAGGYARFLVPLSPLVAIAAAACFDRLWDSRATLHRRSMLLVASSFLLLWCAAEIQISRPETPQNFPGLHAAQQALRITTATMVVLAIAFSLSKIPSRIFCCVLLLLIALTDVALIRILRPSPTEQLIVQQFDWMKQAGLSDRPVVSAHVFAEYLSHPPAPAPNRPGLNRRIDLAPPGSILVWDSQFAPSPTQNLSLSDAATNPSLRRIHESPTLPGQSDPYIILFEKIAPESPGEAKP